MCVPGPSAVWVRSDPSYAHIVAADGVARSRLKLAIPSRAMWDTQSAPCSAASSGSSPRLGAPGSATRRSMRLSSAAVTPVATSDTHHVPPA